MSHFSKGGLGNDPDGHARLKEILHSRSERSRTGATAPVKPTLAARFGVRPARREQAENPVRLVGVDDISR